MASGNAARFLWQPLLSPGGGEDCSGGGEGKVQASLRAGMPLSSRSSRGSVSRCNPGRSWEVEPTPSPYCGKQPFSHFELLFKASYKGAALSQTGLQGSLALPRNDKWKRQNRFQPGQDTVSGKRLFLSPVPQKTHPLYLRSRETAQSHMLEVTKVNRTRD